MPGSAEKAHSNLLAYHNRILSPNRSALFEILRKSKIHFDSATCDKCQLPSQIKEDDQERISIFATGHQSITKQVSS